MPDMSMEQRPTFEQAQKQMLLALRAQLIASVEQIDAAIMAMEAREAEEEGAEDERPACKKCGSAKFVASTGPGTWVCGSDNCRNHNFEA